MFDAIVRCILLVPFVESVVMPIFRNTDITELHTLKTKYGMEKMENLAEFRAKYRNLVVRGEYRHPERRGDCDKFIELNHDYERIMELHAGVQKVGDDPALIAKFHRLVNDMKITFKELIQTKTSNPQLWKTIWRNWLVNLD